jgi:hypothetical protein
MDTTCGITKLLEKKTLGTIAYIFFLNFCDVALVAIIHKKIYPNWL